LVFNLIFDQKFATIAGAKMSEIFDAPFKIRQVSRSVNVLLTSQVAINKVIIRATTAIVVTQLRARLLIKF